MKVGVAILALVRCVGKVEIGVAIAAGHSGVPSAEWKPGLRMIEPDLAPDYFPVFDGMARIAGKVELSVRTDRRCDRSCGLRTQSAHTQQERRRWQDGSREQQ